LAERLNLAVNMCSYRSLLDISLPLPWKFFYISNTKNYYFNTNAILELKGLIIEYYTLQPYMCGKLERNMAMA